MAARIGLPMSKFCIAVTMCVMGACMPLPAMADITTLLRKLTMDRLELDVQVTDESGRPLAGAVIWYNGGGGALSEGKPDGQAMRRMARRYASQSDFLNTNDVPGTVFERTDLNGTYRDYREISGVADGLYPYVVVVAKRGFVTQVMEGAAPLNKRHVVALKLQADTKSAPVDGRMETFDRLLAQTRPVKGIEEATSESRMHRLAALSKQVRDLAQELEKIGRGDDASAVYWALADFPSVTAIDQSDGQTRIVGYANGRIDAQAESDRLKATRLNSTVPKLLIDKARISWGFPRVGIRNAEEGQAYLKAFEDVAGGPFKDGVLPLAYSVAIFQALNWGTPQQACDLIQRAYRFEPLAMSVKNWWGMLGRLEGQRKRLNLPHEPCVIEGLPPR